MKKEALECVEKTLRVVVSVSTCMGMFLIGCLVAKLICGTVSTDTMWNIFLVCLALTYCAIYFWLDVRRKLLEILAEEKRAYDRLMEVVKNGNET